jgi:hypothetical protein
MAKNTKTIGGLPQSNQIDDLGDEHNTPSRIPSDRFRPRELCIETGTAAAGLSPKPDERRTSRSDPAKGILTAIFLSLVFWTLIGFGLWAFW